MTDWIFWSRFPELCAATTTRTGGYSSGDYHGLNLAFQTGDDYAIVLANRQTFLKQADLSEQQLVLCYQSHADTIQWVDQRHGGAGAHSFETGVTGTDSLYTATSHLAVGILHADCVPVFFYVPTHHLVGIIHAGWQGTLKQVVIKTLTEVMVKHHLTPDQIYIYLGPSINGQDQLLWDEIVASGQDVPGFIESIDERQGKKYYDVIRHNLWQLDTLKIKRDHIDVSSYSTYQDAKLFYSYARSLPNKTGRHISFIYLKDIDTSST